MDKLKYNNPLKDELNENLSSLGFHSVSHLSGGHTEATLYRGRNALNDSKVIKISSRKDINEEIDSNKFGYEAIACEGAGLLLPNPLVYGDIDGRHYITMPDLGVDMSQRDRNGDLSRDDYIQFINYLTQAVTRSIQTTGNTIDHANGLAIAHKQLEHWVNTLVSASALESKTVESLLSFDITQLSSSKTSVMIMDFTPDNIFVHEEGVSFIDPWRQDGYRGSFIPSLGQFITLAVSIYKLPQATKAQFDINEAVAYIGDKLDLTVDQVRGQYLMGESLQYILSGFVRLNSDNLLAREYIDMAINAMRELKEITMRIKGEK